MEHRLLRWHVGGKYLLCGGMLGRPTAVQMSACRHQQRRRWSFRCPARWAILSLLAADTTQLYTISVGVQKVVMAQAISCSERWRLFCLGSVQTPHVRHGSVCSDGMSGACMLAFLRAVGWRVARRRPPFLVCCVWCYRKIGIMPRLFQLSCHVRLLSFGFLLLCT